MPDARATAPLFFAATTMALATTAADPLTTAPSIPAATTVAQRRASWRLTAVSGSQYRSRIGRQPFCEPAQIARELGGGLAGRWRQRGRQPRDQHDRDGEDEGVHDQEYDQDGVAERGMNHVRQRHDLDGLVHDEQDEADDDE